MRDEQTTQKRGHERGGPYRGVSTPPSLRLASPTASGDQHPPKDGVNNCLLCGCDPCECTNEGLEIIGWLGDIGDLDR